MLTVECREKKHNEVGAREAWEHVTVESFSCRMLYDCVPRRHGREKISCTSYHPQAVNSTEDYLF
jgi:hypothetical protein